MMLSAVLFIAYCMTFSGHVSGQNQCEAFIDLTLIIDSSGSISPSDFEQAKKALLNLVGLLNVAVEKAGVAIINFASTMSLTANKDVFQFDRTELLKQITELPQIGTNTATGEALALANSYCQAQCRSTGRAVPRIFAIFTDGLSNEGRDAIQAAADIRNTLEGTIFAVGVGMVSTEGQAELLGLAGDPEYVMNIASYTDLARVTNAISMKMCEFPAFVLPDIQIQGEMTGNSSRYYKMHTLNKINKSAFFEIEFTNKVGQVSYSNREKKNNYYIFLSSVFRLSYIHRQRIKNHHRTHQEVLVIERQQAKHLQLSYQQMRKIFILVLKVLQHSLINIILLYVFDHWIFKKIKIY
jgi:hypothetical protein